MKTYSVWVVCWLDGIYHSQMPVYKTLYKPDAEERLNYFSSVKQKSKVYTYTYEINEEDYHND